ncbi:MAG: tRNA (adenosine(37)-N6)-dimethylallyltransferase MiaA, partial [bacterium]
WDLPSMSGIGYREFRADTQVRPYDNDAIFDEIKKHTRQYAKRQMTWFRKDKRIIWVKDYKEMEKLVKLSLRKGA